VALPSSNLLRAFNCLRENEFILSTFTALPNSGIFISLVIIHFISFSNLSYRHILTLFMQIVQPFLHTLKDKPG
jgi:hypothetical protein